MTHGRIWRRMRGRAREEINIPDSDKMLHSYVRTCNCHFVRRDVDLQAQRILLVLGRSRLLLPSSKLQQSDQDKMQWQRDKEPFAAVSLERKAILESFNKETMRLLYAIPTR